MAVGNSLIPAASPKSAPPYTAQITPYVIFTCIMAASGGLMYGYDLVVAGGIAVMNDFLEKFYPNVLRHKQNAKEDNYCKYRNEVFQLFASCLYLAALLATFLASAVTRKFGRRATMLIAGLFFIVGTVLSTAAQNLGMLLAGRSLLGCGIGFANQAVPLYLSEIAPPRLRGGLNYLFVVYASFGIFAGNIVNFFTAKIRPWGWRLSLGLAGIPAIMLTVFSMLLVETPSSLIERGHYEQAKVVLRKVRGSDEIDAEFDDLINASQIAQRVENPFRNLLDRKNRPQLVLAIVLPFFQQVAGNDAILFYGTFLFKTAGFQDNTALYSAVIVGGTGFATTCLAAFVVDRTGRRIILLVASTVMFSAMVVIAIIFAVGLPGTTQRLPRSEGIIEVVMLCLFEVAFSASWGPLAWLIPSEIFPQDVRSAGLSVTVCVNMLFKFLIAQTFLSMLCAFKFGIFLFFGGWLIVMGVFTLLFLPETKGIPIDKMAVIFGNHWFWKRVIPAQEQPMEKEKANA